MTNPIALRLCFALFALSCIAITDLGIILGQGRPDTLNRRLQMPDVDGDLLRLLQVRPIEHLQNRGQLAVERPAAKKPIRVIPHVANQRVFEPILFQPIAAIGDNTGGQLTPRLTIYIRIRGARVQCQLTQIPADNFEKHKKQTRSAVYSSFASQAEEDIIELNQLFSLTESQIEKLRLAAKADARRLLHEIETTIDSLPKDMRLTIVKLSSKSKEWQTTLQRSLLQPNSLFGKVANTMITTEQADTYARKVLTKPLQCYAEFLSYPPERQYMVIDATFSQPRPIDLGQLKKLSHEQQTQLGDMLLEANHRLHGDSVFALTDPANSRVVFHVVEAEKKPQVINEVQLMLIEKLLREQARRDR